MRSCIVAYLLWFFLGFFSAHRFYTGNYGTAIIYLVTGQLFGIGFIIDLFLIPSLVNQANLKTKYEHMVYMNSRF
ncbi:MAG: NINE protein [Hyphomicrobiales bacterium]